MLGLDVAPKDLYGIVGVDVLVWSRSFLIITCYLDLKRSTCLLLHFVLNLVLHGRYNPQSCKP